MIYAPTSGPSRMHRLQDSGQANRQGYSECNLINCRINDDNIHELVSALGTNTNIQKLVLRCNDIGVKGLKTLLSGLPQSINILDLSDNFISDECISDLLQCLHLNILLLEGNPITDKGAEDILRCNKSMSISVERTEMSSSNKSQIHIKFPLPTPTIDELKEEMDNASSVFFRNYKPIDTRKLVNRTLAAVRTDKAAVRLLEYMIY
jgi:Leucine-rich repeat (LRR) protein